jgi:nucleotide-binding universal stress UspA family protein
MTTKKIEKILVPITLTSEGKIAIEQAVKFQAVFGSTIVVMNVIPPPNNTLKNLLAWKSDKKTLDKAYQRLEGFVKCFFGNKIPDYIKLDVRTGTLIASIIDASIYFGSELIIIKKSKRIIGKFATFRKNNADKLIGQSFCPVLTISENFTHEGIKDIVMPVDITKNTDEKVRWAIYLAKNFNARITMISVLDINIEVKKSLAYRKATHIEDQLINEQIECDILLITETSGANYEIFLRQVSKINPDLIIIMTHEESILFSDYIGRFAREVIHRAVQPVFNVVPRAGTHFSV